MSEISKDKPHIVIHGYYGAGNFGDDIILMAMVDSLLGIEPNLDITILSRNISPLPIQFPIRAVSRFDVAAVEAVINSADLLICGGGGIFQDYSGFTVKDHFGTRTKSLDYYTVPIEMAYLLGKPVMLYAIGAGPLFSEISRRYLNTVLNWADVITVRDEDSAAMIKSLNQKANPIITADPAINYTPKAYMTGPFKGTEKYVGICLRNWFFEEKERANFIGFFAQMADYLAQCYGFRIALFPFSKSKTDAIVLNDVRQAMVKKDEALLLEGQTIDQTVGLLRHAAFITGMRLHSVIVSTSHFVPAAGISYDDKVSNYMGLLGMQDYLLEINKISGNSPKEFADTMVVGQEQIKARLKKVIPVLQEREKKNAVLAINLLRRK